MVLHSTSYGITIEASASMKCDFVRVPPGGLLILFTIDPTLILTIINRNLSANIPPPLHAPLLLEFSNLVQQ